MLFFLRYPLILNLFFSSYLFANDCSQLSRAYLKAKILELIPSQLDQKIPLRENACTIFCSMTVIQLALKHFEYPPITQVVSVMNQLLTEIAKERPDLKNYGFSMAELYFIFDEIVERLKVSKPEFNFSFKSTSPTLANDFEMGVDSLSEDLTKEDILAIKESPSDHNKGIVRTAILGISMKHEERKKEVQHVVTLLDAQSFRDEEPFITILDPIYPDQPIKIKLEPASILTRDGHRKTFQLLPTDESSQNWFDGYEMQLTDIFPISISMK